MVQFEVIRSRHTYKHVIIKVSLNAPTKNKVGYVNVPATHLLEQVTGEKTPKSEDTNINSAAVALGHLGGFKGGKARDNILTP